MARLKDREKALRLRIEEEMSYSHIKKILGVSKGTLSYWLKDYPLSKKRIRELGPVNEQRIERCRETKRRKKEQRLKNFYKEQKRLIFPLNKGNLFLAGLFLYWGEGSKSQMNRLRISNTDPAMIKFFITWLTKSLNVQKEKLTVHLHLYSDMNIDEKTNFWSRILNIPQQQFCKPYIKKSSSVRINHKGAFGHGTCNVSIANARLTEKVHMSIKAIGDKYK